MRLTDYLKQKIAHHEQRLQKAKKEADRKHIEWAIKEAELRSRANSKQ
jgi:hypothetical protein